MITIQMITSSIEGDTIREQQLKQTIREQQLKQTQSWSNSWSGCNHGAAAEADIIREQ